METLTTQMEEADQNLKDLKGEQTANLNVLSAVRAR